MNNQEVKSIMESVFFISTEPVTKNQFTRLLDIGKEQVSACLKELEVAYCGQRGIQLVSINDGYQFSTNNSNYFYVERFCKNINLKKLSQQALEVLSIVAYKQPITKGEIELIRGVQSSGVVNTLMEKGFLKINGHLDKIGRPLIYGTTDSFLKAFGFASLEDLPDINSFQNADLFMSLKE
jgi:segregation and condensation protein B